ncbi:MAG: hypothetical protein OXE94_03355, partial [Aestuariivita sp.]|nr:hypothetical protein [Aestuariivita sp.]MCY4201913.1 hypothetical protein [Aestuariivita sp.]MCY4287825.1 hypothetical protein [Aestuariivita sp.]MCY4345911.1 hypothetical protein [Aestuariivita sp.]
HRARRLSGAAITGKMTLFCLGLSDPKASSAALTRHLRVLTVFHLLAMITGGSDLGLLLLARLSQNLNTGFAWPFGKSELA